MHEPRRPLWKENAFLPMLPSSIESLAIPQMLYALQIRPNNVPRRIEVHIDAKKFSYLIARNAYAKNLVAPRDIHVVFIVEYTDFCKEIPAGCQWVSVGYARLRSVRHLTFCDLTIVIQEQFKINENFMDKILDDLELINLICR